MKHSKIAYFIGLSIIMALLVLLFPVPAYAASESIYREPIEGRIGDWIAINVYNFNSCKMVHIYFSSDKADVSDNIGSEVTAYQQIVEASTFGNGSFVSIYYFVVPDRLTDGERKEDVHNGDYYLYATYNHSTSIVCRAKFTVLPGEIEVNPEEGVVGSEVEISGGGLRQNQKISVEYDGDKVDIISGDSKSDSKGQFVCTIIIPESVSDNHTITVIDESGDSPEVEFSVKPKITLDPIKQAMGGVVKVNGTGFPEEEAIKLAVGGRRVDTTPLSINTDDRGSFSGSFVVPFLDNCGLKQVTASFRRDVMLADARLAVLPGVTLSPMTSPASPGHVGMELTVRSVGFIAEAKVTITYTNNDEAIPVATATVDAKGNFSVSFTVPPSVAGSHTITATDGSTVAISTFTMESQAPLMPVLLLPKATTTAEAAAYFDWKDVTDPSGVSYTLQVATDADFTNIVLEEEGLTQAEYAVSEAEKLASTKGGAPYCWRVRAVDGASNEGDWSLSGVFYVGSSRLSNLVLYVFCGLGVLLLVIVVFWWRRRRAASSKE